MVFAYILMKARGYYSDDEWVDEEQNVSIYLDQNLAFAEAARLNNIRDEFGTELERVELSKRFHQWMHSFYRGINRKKGQPFPSEKEIHKQECSFFDNQNITDLAKREWIKECPTDLHPWTYKVQEYPIAG